MVSGWVHGGGSGKAGWYERLHGRYTKPVHDAGIPYSLVVGNHDREGDLTALQILALDSRSSNHSYTGTNYAAEGTDYIVPVYASNDDDTTRVAIFMVFLDTGRRGCENYKGKLELMDGYDGWI